MKDCRSLKEYLNMKLFPGADEKIFRELDLYVKTFSLIFSQDAEKFKKENRWRYLNILPPHSKKAAKYFIESIRMIDEYNNKVNNGEIKSYREDLVAEFMALTFIKVLLLGMESGLEVSMKSIRDQMEKETAP